MLEEVERYKIFIPILRGISDKSILFCDYLDFKEKKQRGEAIDVDCSIALGILERKIKKGAICE